MTIIWDRRRSNGMIVFKPYVRGLQGHQFKHMGADAQTVGIFAKIVKSNLAKRQVPFSTPFTARF